MSSSNSCCVGVLALQGDFDAHCTTLRRIGCQSRQVKTVQQLAEIDGLIIPGAESTALLKLMNQSLFAALGRFPKPILGTCAGVILLASEVTSPPQRSLGLLDVTVERNSYGRQLESFESSGRLSVDGVESDLEMVFIRAPRITRVGGGVVVLARHKGDCVLVRQGNILGATFHPELTADVRVHELLVSLIRPEATALADQAGPTNRSD